MYKGTSDNSGLKCARLQITNKMLASCLGLDEKNFVLTVYRETDDVARNSFKIIVESPYVDRVVPENGEWPLISLSEIVSKQNESYTKAE